LTFHNILGGFLVASGFARTEPSHSILTEYAEEVP